VASRDIHFTGEVRSTPIRLPISRARIQAVKDKVTVTLKPDHIQLM
jgi:hypothetical protein